MNTTAPGSPSVLVLLTSKKCDEIKFLLSFVLQKLTAATVSSKTYIKKVADSYILHLYLGSALHLH